jgi:hypothetical protein
MADFWNMMNAATPRGNNHAALDKFENRDSEFCACFTSRPRSNAR